MQQDRFEWLGIMLFLKWCHYALPFSGLFTIPALFKPRMSNVFYTKVKFDESIRYHIGSDQSDVNKLFGIAYRWHHQDSDRVGFRYIPERDEVEIVLYSYLNGERLKTMVCDSIKLNEWTEVILNSRVDGNFREVYLWVGNKEVHYSGEFKPWKWLWYSLTGYFGGNRRAPQRIKVECK